MQIILYTLLVITTLMMLFCLFMMHRNLRVFNYRRRIIDGVFDHKDWPELERVFMKVSYNDMVYKFWKPLDSFFDDDFLKKIGVKK